MRLKRRRLKELLSELGKTGMQFGCLNRFNHLMNPKVVELYSEAGFNYFYCAIEQFDNLALASMVKNQKTSQIVQSVNTLHECGFKLGVSLLYGFEFETEKSVLATLDFTKEWVDRGLIQLVSESLLSYHPGTAQGKSAEGQRAIAEGFNRVPPNLGFPWNRCEEGQWYHPSHVTASYVEKVLGWSEERFSDRLIRNRHSWAYANRAEQYSL